MKKFFKIVFVSILVIFSISFAICGVFLLVPTKTELNENLLIVSNDFANFYDARNCLLTNDREVLAPDEEIKSEIVGAVISGEDKNFYSHHGIDYARIVKAAFVNLKNGNFSQGASTISQQLIKNTHLTQEKTIKRKLKEIKLAQKLEKTYSKDRILNMYLNTIYFGCNNYGIKDAARYYFSKDISELDLNECATIAGIIPSPERFNPVENISVSKKKRNEILERMKKNGYISEDERARVSALEIPLNVTEDSGAAISYRSECLSEIYSQTDLTPYDLASANIYTYYDEKLQNTLIESKTENDRDYCSVVIDNKTMGVPAFYSTCGSQLRSPASTVKPLLVYAPAFELGFIHEMTKLADRPATFGGFQATNYKDKYYGSVSAKFALANSLNVPAVSLYNSLGKEKCKSYLEKLGITDSNENLDLALGRFDKGVTIKSLAEAYTVFPNLGIIKRARFVRTVTDKFGRTVYSPEDESEKVFSSATTAIINDILADCVKTGTAKKLTGYSYELCAKTGTGGNENGNTDAFVVAYTSEHTLCAWSGYADSRLMDNSVTGASSPCVSARTILDHLYKDKTPADMEKNGVVKLRIDKASYDDKGEFLLAEENAFDKDCYEFLFDKRYAPSKKATHAAPDADNIGLIDDGESIRLRGEKEYFVRVEKKTENGRELIFDGAINDFRDKDIDDATYYITPYFKYNNMTVTGKTVEKKVKRARKNSESIPSEWWKDV